MKAFAKSINTSPQEDKDELLEYYLEGITYDEYLDNETILSSILSNEAWDELLEKRFP